MKKFTLASVMKKKSGNAAEEQRELSETIAQHTSQAPFIHRLEKDKVEYLYDATIYED